MHSSFLSDLKKTTEVVESLSITSTRCFVTEITNLLQDLINRMINLHQNDIFAFNFIGHVYYISHSVIEFMLSKFSVYRIIVFFSQRQAFTAYRSASSGPVENILPAILISKIIIFIIF